MIFDQQQAIMFGGILTYPDWAFSSQAINTPGETDTITGTSTDTSQAITGTIGLEE